MNRFHLGSVVACLCLPLPACSEDADACKVVMLNGQPRERLPVGTTYFMPAIENDGCEAASWELTNAPEASTNSLVHGDDGYDRFTPDVPGAYRFTNASGDDILELKVIDGGDVPFINYNYYPTRSLAQVDTQLWVANGFTPRVTRIDPASSEVLGTIDVGAWPVAIAWSEGMDVALVAQRAADTLGLVDIDAGKLVDAIWVGDEPSNVVVHPGGNKAYVALPNQAAVAVVDLEARELVTTIEVGPDPLGLEISPDGATLFVSSHRSGHPNRFPYPADPVEDEHDLSIIDTDSNTVVHTVVDLGTTIKQLYMPADGQTLYVSHLRNDTEASLSDPNTPNFLHFVTALDPSSGTVLRQTDVARQPSSAGPIATLHGMTLVGDKLWVAVEGNDLLIALDPVTLEELQRVEVSGRPRHVLGFQDSIFVHGVQDLSVISVNAEGSVRATIPADTDPRTPEAAAGQRYFTGVGRDFATTWACNSCHADGLTDTLIWNAGPFDNRVVTRPFTWLEGIDPLGWAGYLSSVKNYAYVVNQNVGIRPTTDEALNLGTYIGSIMAPPAGNAWTRRDGELSDAAKRGRELFEGEGNCASCHPLPLTSSLGTLANGITPGVSKTAALVGAYRYATWLKHGEARTLRDAVEAAATFAKADLDADQLDDLTRFVSELTGRDFFVLTSTPQRGDDHAAIDRPIRLTFTQAVFDARKNLDRIHLRDAGGNDVAMKTVVDGRHATIIPENNLAFASNYTIEIEESFESFGERKIYEKSELEFHTAAAPTVTMATDYVWTIEVPGFKSDGSGLDKENTTKTNVPMRVTPTASGAHIMVDYGQELVYEGDIVIDGDELLLPPLPVPMGPSFVDSDGSRATFIDSDMDGIGDIAESTFIVQGPGLSESGIRWSLALAGDDDACEEGTSGAVLLDVTTDAESGDISITWDATDAALGLYVTDPLANVPAGGGVVTGGNTYWALVTSSFPDGFAQPVTYGVVPEGAMDDTATHMGTFETPIPGKCYKFTVATTAFAVGERVLRWPE